jgi:small conductance mechanosensitive channel
MLKAYAATAAQYGQETTGETASELAKLIEVMISKVPLWIAAFIVIVMSFFVAKIARSIIQSKLADKVDDDHEEVQILAGRITHTTVLVIGITVGLKIAGIDLTSIIAAVAFGIGFALKDIIMNFLAGVMILVGRQFSIGDFIKIGDTMGKIVEIQSRVTILQAIDGTKVVVPNADLFSHQITSMTSNPFRRIDILVGVDYRNDLENVVRICMKAMKETQGVLLEPKPTVVVSEFGDSAINLKVRAWVESRGGWLVVKSNLIIKIKKSFDEYGITIPWPIRTVAYDKDQDYTEKILEEEKEEESAEAAPVAGEQPALEPELEPVTTTEVPLTGPQTAPAEAVAAAPVASPAPAGGEALKPLGEQKL